MVYTYNYSVLGEFTTQHKTYRKDDRRRSNRISPEMFVVLSTLIQERNRIYEQRYQEEKIVRNKQMKSRYFLN